jgi:predicted transport protein
MQDASEELSTELTISDLRNIARLIKAVRNKVTVGEGDIEIVKKIEQKIESFLHSINESI